MRFFNDLFMSPTPTPVMLTEHDTRELESVRCALAEVTDAVRTAQLSLDAGRTVDLSGMDTRMERLCAQALELPVPFAHATLPDLMALLDTVDALIGTLTTRPAR